MTYQEFKNKYNGQYVDVDGYPKEWKWQCFDLVQLYNIEVLNVPDYVLAGCGVVKNMLYGEERRQLDEYFDEVDVHEMQEGDVCIWDEGVAGHIAIYDHYDGANCWYFSQNPNPSQIMIVNMQGHHAFRRKKEMPPLPPVADNVERDEYKDQLEIKVSDLRVRTQPTLNGDILGYAKEGFYNFYEKAENDGYIWYKIADNEWVAYNDEWINIYPKKEKEEFVQFKVLNKKDGYLEIDLGKVYIKEEEK